MAANPNLPATAPYQLFAPRLATDLVQVGTSNLGLDLCIRDINNLGRN